MCKDVLPNITGIKNVRQITHEQRLRVLTLPSLEYRRARDDMTETFKIIHGFYDTETGPCSSP